MSSLYFQISSVFYIILLIVVYFSKKRIKLLENKVYVVLVVTNLIGLVLDITSTYIALVDINNILLNPLCKVYLVYLITWVFMFTFYVFIISSKSDRFFNTNSNDDIRNQINKKLLNILIPIYIIIVLVTFVLPLYNYSKDGIVYTYGPGATFSYLISGLCILIWISRLVLNYKNLKQKKYIPIFSFIAIGIIVMVMQSIYPQLLLVTAMESFITFLMYFTIENPDLQLIEELNLAKEQAVKANNSKSEFLSSMSHEIRTPLNAIVGFSQSLVEQDISDSIKEDVNYIMTASEGLLEIVNGILDISKIEANKLEIINNEYSLKKVLDEIVSLAKGRLGDKPLEFRTNFDPNIPAALYGDHIRLKQIIINLVTNSIKYTKVGYIEFKVSAIVKNDICRLIIAVEDSGIGIAKDKIDKLFTKFERFDEEKNVSIEGTGLGLAITKKLVDLMNGQIVVQSVYEKGSKFTVAIDQKIVATPSQNFHQTNEPEIEEFDCSGKKILVVDDNKINLKVAARLLSKYNIDVTEVSSGFECLDKINAGESYDLILCDDMMPKMSGVETLKKLKEIRDFNIPTIALTANAISGMKEKYLSVGFDDYLSKPIERPELNRVIKKFLNK